MVLIDEADVFLQERGIHDIYRNGIVAVFLRQLEYFQGILFLTTNRVKRFDEAFESRIHVSLKYGDLTEDARKKIWLSFFKKVGIKVGREDDDMPEYELDMLAGREVNGRQIKNAIRTAQALAINRKEPLGLNHFSQVIDTMEQFHRDLQLLHKSGTSGGVDD